MKQNKNDMFIQNKNNMLEDKMQIKKENELRKAEMVQLFSKYLLSNKDINMNDIKHMFLNDKEMIEHFKNLKLEMENNTQTEKVITDMK